MIIRIATPADAGDLARMNAAFNGVSDSAAQIAARLVACADIETAILAELDGQVGGFACVRVVPCVLYAEPYAELTELYVEPAFRRRGLGRALIALRRAAGARARRVRAADHDRRRQCGGAGALSRGGLRYLRSGAESKGERED